ncbi:MAG TPA: BMP family ABC transporter substrate-binding protein [Chloroflexota bacterium]|nr:BMP family ABC transporter substrate-binding protein [Chloroflexota bacterium]
MSRRVRVLAPLALVGLLVAACGSSTGSGNSNGVSASKKANKPFSAVLVVNGTLGDKGFFDSAARGIGWMHTRLGATTKILQASPTNPSEWLQNLQAVSNGRYNLVVTGTSQMTNDMQSVGKAHPKQKYIFFDDIVKLPNVADIIYKQNEGSFLAGVLAAEAATDTKDFPLSKGAKKEVGLVGGMNIPVINDFVVGFKKGVAYVNPGVKVVVTYPGTFSDPQAGYNQAAAMYQQGAAVVYNVAGATGLGVLKASKTFKRYSIGVDSNQNGLYPGHVLASMVKHVDISTYDLAKKYQQGTLKYDKTYIFGLNNDGVGLIIDHSLVPSRIVAKITKATHDVATGKVKVPSTLHY